MELPFVVRLWLIERGRPKKDADTSDRGNKKKAATTAAGTKKASLLSKRDNERTSQVKRPKAESEEDELETLAKDASALRKLKKGKMSAEDFVQA